MGQRRGVEPVYPPAVGQRSRRIFEAELPYLSSGITALTRELPLAFERASNDLLWDADGVRYIDWSGGTLTASTGHCNENVARAITAQLDRLWNIHDHPSAARARLLRRLQQLMPSPDYLFQFYSTGSEGVEAALRGALSAVSFRRRRVATYAEGFHGKTRGSLMSVHALYGRNVQPAHLAPLSLPFPRCYRCPYEMRREDCRLHCAAVHVQQLEQDRSVGLLLYEPMLGTGGAHCPPDGYWELLGPACRRLGILLVADEVSTGAWRTGSFLACEQLDLEPDLVVFAKGIASGFPAMVLGGRSALMRDPDVFDAGAEPRLAGGDFRAPGSSSSTYGGNPLALAAMDATLDEFERLDLRRQVETVGHQLRAGLDRLGRTCPSIGDVRGRGMLLAVELVADRQSREPAPGLALELYRRCAARGLLIKVDDVGIVHINPPLTHTAENAAAALQIFGETLHELAGEVR